MRPKTLYNLSVNIDHVSYVQFILSYQNILFLNIWIRQIKCNRSESLGKTAFSPSMVSTTKKC